MTDNLASKAREIYLQLSTLDTNVLEAELDRLVGDDARLKDAVVSLIDAQARADRDDFMSSPTASTTAMSATITESAGSVIGRYKLLQLIGEGGFGSVFLAEQSRPVRRRVALKIIKLGMDTKQVIARFEAERQALAMMDHPHIARVYDAGATETGRPYFAMEYVVGDAITKFADAHKLDIPARLALFSQVCSAVQHAHTKGVIHRDLKPANVLVSTVDGKPFAKVIDFGIAKATASPLTEKTLFTEHRQLIGTPEYMSPEQAEGSPDIDTRTDVYALGVLLYELLTGVTPFDAKRLRSAAFGEMQRIIKEEDPPAPSLRLTRNLESLAQTAMARQVEPAKLSTAVRGELDWIVMKALDKDRARRYESAAQFAGDVGNHLAGEAVEAAPPSRGYLIRKLVRRNKGVVIACSVISATLLLGIAGTSVGLFVADHNFRAATHNANLLLDSRDEAEWSAYTANLALAQSAMDAGDWSGARERLAECPESKRGWEWSLLSNKAHSVLREFRGDGTAVSPDGEYVLSIAGSQAMLYLTNSDELPVRIQTDAPLIPNGEISFSEDSGFVALTTWESSEHSSYSTRVFRTDGKPVTDPKGDAIPGYGGRTFFLSPNGEVAISLRTRPDHSDPRPLTDKAAIYAITGDILAELPQKGHDLTGVAFHPDDVHIVLTSKAGGLIWNPQTGDVADLPLESAWYFDPWITNDGKHLVAWYRPNPMKEQVAGSKQGRGVVIVPLEEPDAVVTINNTTPNQFQSAVADRQPGNSNNGPWFITASDDGTITRRNMRGEPIGTSFEFNRHGRSGLHIDEVIGDMLVWNASMGMRVLRDWSPIGQPFEWHERIRSAAIDSEDKSTLISDYNGIARYDREGKLTARVMMPYSEKDMWFYPSEITPGPAGILSQISDVDSDNGTTRMLFSRDLVSSVYFFPDHWHAELWVNAAIESNTQREITAQASAMVESVRTLTPTATSFAALSDGSRVFAAVGREIGVWNPTTGRRVASFRVPYDIESLEISADDGLLIARLRGGAAMFFDSRPVEAQHADAVRFGVEQDAARALVAAMLAGPLPTEELESSLANDASLPAVRKLAATMLLEHRIEEIRSDSSRLFREITEGQTDAAVVLKRAETAKLSPRIKERVIVQARAWEYQPSEQPTEDLLADEQIRRRLVEADLAIRFVGEDSYVDEKLAAAHRIAMLDAMRTYRTLRPIFDQSTYDAVTTGFQNAGTGRNLYLRAESAMRANDLGTALNLAIEAPGDRLTTGKPEDLRIPITDTWSQANPCELAVLAMTRFKLSLAEPEWLEAAARIDQKLLGASLTPEEHLAAAHQAIAQARTIMADAAALNNSGVPWSQDTDAVALLAEAETLLSSQATLTEVP